MRVLIIASVLVLWFYDQNSLWLRYHEIIPGGIGIRAVGRIVLFLLIPAALGLAALVQFLEQKQRTLAPWIVVLVCTLEQGVTTESFDAAENRAAIARIARQVDPGQEAFYYRPRQNRVSSTYHLEAMWASLATGVPTINGYSGYSPPGWDGFLLVDAQPTVHPQDVLAQWERAHGLAPSGSRPLNCRQWRMVRNSGECRVASQQVAGYFHFPDQCRSETTTLLDLRHACEVP